MHDKSKFEIFCYSFSESDGSDWRKLIEETCEHFILIDAKTPTFQGAEIIHRHNLHILINLNGFTNGNRNDIFAVQPAPIQMLFLGFIGTMGANWMQESS